MTASFYLAPLSIPVRTKSKSRSNASHYPLFSQLSSLIEDPFWQMTFSKIGMDNIPTGFNIRQGYLTCRRNNKTFKLQLIINGVNESQGLAGLNLIFLPLFAATETNGFIDNSNNNVNILNLITPGPWTPSLRTPSLQTPSLQTPALSRTSSTNDLSRTNSINDLSRNNIALATPLTYNINLSNTSQMAITHPQVNTNQTVNAMPVLESASFYLTSRLLQQQSMEFYLLQAFIIAIIQFFKDYGGIYSPNDYKRFSNNQLKQNRTTVANWIDLDKTSQKQLMEQFFCKEVSKLPYDSWQQEYAKTQLLLYYYYGNINTDQIVFEHGQIQQIRGLNLAEGLPMVVAPKKSRSAAAKPIEDPLLKHWKKYWSAIVE